MHRLVKASMHALRFWCPMAGCEHHKDYKNEDEEQAVEEGKQPEPKAVDDVGLAYLDALKHLKTCKFLAHYCEMGCGERLMCYEVEEHQKQCPNFEEHCDTCEQYFKPNHPDP